MAAPIVKITTLIHLLFVIIKNASSAEDCSPPNVNISCNCETQYVSCTGQSSINTDIIDIISTINMNFNLSTSLETLIINIKDLDFMPNSTFMNGTIKDLTLGNGLRKLENYIFIDLQSTLTRLSLANNNFENVPSNAVHILKNLEYLDMSHNNIISLSDRDFSGLINLKQLYLHHNHISVTIEAFVSLDNLEILDLTFNNLHNLKIEMFENLQKLKVLNLSSNYIEDLHPNIIKDLRSLVTLNIDNNNIKSFEKIDIISSSLKNLSASNCSLQGTLNNSTLNHVPNLRTLNLSKNGLKSVSNRALSRLHHLEMLNLRLNQIEALENFAFSELNKLEELVLEHNKIAVVKKMAFRNLTSLKMLNMNYNRLEGFFCSYTTDLYALEELQLCDNRIRMFHPGTLYLSPHLNTLKLSGNLIDCSTTCSAVYFSSYIKSYTSWNEADINEILCQSPGPLIGKRIIDVAFDPIVCSATNFTQDKPCSSESDDDDYIDYKDDDIDYKDDNETIISTVESMQPTSVTPSQEISAASIQETFVPSTQETSVPSTQTSIPSTQETSVPSIQETSVVSTKETSVALTTHREINTSSTVTNVSSDADTSTLYTNYLTGDLNITTSFNEINSTITYDYHHDNTTEIKPDNTTLPEIMSTPYTTTDYTNTTDINIKNETITSSITEEYLYEYITVTRDSNNTDTKISEKLRNFPLQPDVTRKYFPMKPFNITYFNIIPDGTTSSVIQWSVNRKELLSECYLTVSVTTDDSNHTMKSFMCSDGSYRLTDISLNTMYNACISSHHQIHGNSTFCHSIYYPSEEFSSPRNKDETTSNFPFIVLITLLLIVIGIVLVLVARRIVRQRRRGDHYGVSDEEKKVQKRDHKRQSGHSVRYSYTFNEADTS